MLNLPYSLSRNLLIVFILYLDPVFVIAQINFTEHPVTANLIDAHFVDVADLDGDEDLDIVVTAYEGNTIAWYENDGEQHFTGHILSDNFISAIDVQAVDIDSDDDQDVLGVSLSGNRVTWWENQGESDFIEHDVAVNFGMATSAYGIDFDGDEDVDILACANGEDRIVWFENDGNQIFSEHVISTTFTRPLYVRPADLDQDGDLDVSVAGDISQQFAWLENIGLDSFQIHVLYQVSGLNIPRILFPVDFDGDEDLDLVGSYLAFTPEGGILWFEQTAAGQFETRIIPTSAQFPYGVNVADLDQDDDLDLLATDDWDSEIWWYERVDQYTFLQHDFNVSHCAPYDIQAVDLDDDSDQDVILICRSQVNGIDVMWLESDLFSSSVVVQAEPPEGFELYPNYPNPFNVATTIEYDVRYPSYIRLRIYNLAGREVCELVNRTHDVGRHSTTWDASEFTSGIYFARLEAGVASQTLKLVLLK